ncbi:DUF805 domain-containing protein [Novosphingobium mangrovi (ex Huang et al. 2023)]|uniref:DUF805 domain-containing protein n=1 Tax=Novosphingobium mangrovi (ex Huang et al. 2023) TaxID=2976432 RepID=A0ABT2I250_9SPHN|nr:DUF805 domain-containing protein [Novosphingobium mangrovi (ex Huang et al. 2023)]MCT2398882.1 DUF805 domain-containing protein [Novosphingobium mangrovi (ex Huang et al. 2023)]
MFQYMIMPFNRYADFSGRSRRMEYWGFTLLNAIIISVFVIAAMGFNTSILSSSLEGARPDISGGVSIFLILGFIYILAVLIPSIAVTVRRLHDRDMSGWWYLGFIVLGALPVIGLIASLAMLVIMFLPGTAGPNRYGEDPKDPTGSSIFA